MDLTVPQLIGMLHERDALLSEAHRELGRMIEDAVQKDSEYRRSKAVVILRSEQRNAQQREAETDLECWRLRAKAKIAEGLKDAQMELVKSRRTQVTAIQSALNAVREEASAVRGNSYTP